MKTLHLPPNDPRMQTMTLEQRNYCIININEDALEAEGKTGDVAGDSSADKWMNAPEKDFHVIPKGLNPKKVIHNIRQKVGLSELQLDDQIYKHVMKVAPLKHAYRNGKALKEENIATQELKAKAHQKAKQQGSTSELDKLMQESKKKQF